MKYSLLRNGQVFKKHVTKNDITIIAQGFGCKGNKFEEAVTFLSKKCKIEINEEIS